jgi:hypothetical protein
MKTFKKLNCHPRKSKKRQTCYDDNELILLKNDWNKQRPELKIHVSNPLEIWEELKNKIADCPQELCWVDKLVKDTSLKGKLYNNFVPKTPESWNKNKNEWLDSNNIKNVLDQYKEHYKNFTYLGPSPIDFDKKIRGVCVWPELCNLSLKDQLKKGITKLGVVLNIDKHTMGGSHWVGLFIDLKEKYIFYFDSCDGDIPPEVTVFTNKMVNQAKSLKIKLRKFTNKGLQHQEGTTECGMYVLYFIINLLENSADIM